MWQHINPSLRYILHTAATSSNQEKNTLRHQCTCAVWLGQRTAHPGPCLRGRVALRAWIVEDVVSPLPLRRSSTIQVPFSSWCQLPSAMKWCYNYVFKYSHILRHKLIHSWVVFFVFFVSLTLKLWEYKLWFIKCKVFVKSVLGTWIAKSFTTLLLIKYFIHTVICSQCSILDYSN